MSFSSGSGYDLTTVTWSPEGRVYQVEYAIKYVDTKAPLGLGLVCTDGVLLAHNVTVPGPTAKVPSNSLMVTHAIDENLCVSFVGLLPDGLCLVERARSEASGWRSQFHSVMNAKILSNRLALYMGMFTEYYHVRPFGCNIYVASYDKINGSQLYSIDASGKCTPMLACAQGIEKQAARTELEKLVSNKISIEEAKKGLMQILVKCFDETSSKKVIKNFAYVGKSTKRMNTVSYDDLVKLEEKVSEELDEDDDDDDEEDE